MKVVAEPVEITEEPKKKKTKAPIKKSNKTTLSQKFSKTHIDSIAKALKLNQRIGMIKKLFGGDDELFKSEIKNLDTAANIKDAKNHLDRLKNNGRWNDEDQWYVLLTQLVERRHS